jgi:hypothetical protein
MGGGPHLFPVQYLSFPSTKRLQKFSLLRRTSLTVLFFVSNVILFAVGMSTNALNVGIEGKPNSSGLTLKCNITDVEIKTRSVEWTLQPLINQVILFLEFKKKEQDNLDLTFNGSYLNVK